jgi:ATP-dependent DNA helicase RecQ
MILRLRRLFDGPRSALAVDCELLPLPGPWPAGVTLSKHSLDGDEGRSEIGDLLDRFKYAGERRLAGPLARALATALREMPAFGGIDFIVHAPATTRRLRVPPTRDLARRLAKEMRVRCLLNFIACTRALAHQKDLFHPEEKRQNVHGAFRVCRAEFITKRKLLLIDDVFDSGATLEEIWRVLMHAGAREVTVATITKTRYRRDR